MIINHPKKPYGFVGTPIIKNARFLGRFKSLSLNVK